ncbi:hypothetical protein H5410_031299 [Solanum commersonii]|uniref:Uncharacterized protein n=1 Tax=Solanum commersonii TaxID=4109 RepID=A0A9J5YI13_SOLCO|nr:hypothetical protein H5410_031299 [Solanum commersonii]
MVEKIFQGQWSWKKSYKTFYIIGIIKKNWPSGLGLGLPCWRSQVRNPLPTKARGLPSGSSSSHRACLVRVTSPMWFASYCIGAGILPCAHPKGSSCGFALSSKKNKRIVWDEIEFVKGLMEVCGDFNVSRFSSQKRNCNRRTRGTVTSLKI